MPRFFSTLASFHSINAGPGDMLHITLTKASRVIATPGRCVGRAAAVTVQREAWEGTMRQIGRAAAGAKSAGGMEVYSTKAETADMLINAPTLGEIAILQLDGLATYHIDPKAFIAMTDTLSILPSWKGKGFYSDRKIVYQVTGKGTLAIHTHGGIFRMALHDAETYLVDPRYLVAWTARLHPQPIGKESVEAPDSYFIQRGKRGVLRGWRWLMGSRDLYRVEGPGDVFLQSRIQAPMLIRERLRRPINPEELPPYDATLTERLTPAAHYVWKNLGYLGRQSWKSAMQATNWLISKGRQSTSQTSSTGSPTTPQAERMNTIPPNYRPDGGPIPPSSSATKSPNAFSEPMNTKT